jgi:arylsulfatase A-like enzyme
VLVGKGAIAAALAVALTTAALAVGCGGDDVEPNPPVKPNPAYGDQPNIVFIYTDDQDFSSFRPQYMPNTFNDIADPGTVFSNYYDATPLCCPARAGVLTGQYGHNNGVLANKPGYGTLDDNDNDLPVWLQRAGYRTAIVGKFLNGYEDAVDDKDDVAPGWDRWTVEIGNGRGYYDFKLAVNGRQRKERHKGDYLTTVLNDRAVEDVHDLSGEEPFFLWVTQSAPHVENINANSGGPCGGQSVPPPRDTGRFPDVQLPRAPGVRESDVTDKPAIVSGQPFIGAKKREVLRHRYECRVETLPAVDRGVGRLFRTLRRTGEIDNTIVVFSSDNGTFDGQHRLPGGKGLAYEEAAHLPLAIRVPPKYLGGATPPATVSELVANIDYAPTVVDWAGTEPCPEVGDCRVMDGRSWLGLLTGDRAGWPADRAVGTELDLEKDSVQPGRGISCSFEGVRQDDWLYVLHTALPDLATGVCEPSDVAELYDHRRDPYELRNLAPTTPGTPDAAAEERLGALSATISDCAGVEGRDPEPDSGHWCGTADY